MVLLEVLVLLALTVVVVVWVWLSTVVLLCDVLLLVPVVVESPLKVLPVCCVFEVVVALTVWMVMTPWLLTVTWRGSLSVLLEVPADAAILVVAVLLQLRRAIAGFRSAAAAGLIAVGAAALERVAVVLAQAVFAAVLVAGALPVAGRLVVMVVRLWSVSALSLSCSVTVVEAFSVQLRVWSRSLPLPSTLSVAVALVRAPRLPDGSLPWSWSCDVMKLSTVQS